MNAQDAASNAIQLPETVDISPSPRILQVLGDIEFEQWQCVAELADNSFDEFLEIRRADLAWDEFIVTVVLRSRDNPDTIEVRDTGRGMTLENIRDAVRAGWTGNDQLTGGNEVDSINGGSDEDVIKGGADHDGLTGASGRDIVAGEDGEDRIDGGLGKDEIDGGNGGDNVVAFDSQRDRIVCGAGYDIVRADRGDEIANDCEKVLVTSTR